ncbi:RHS repeat-associated core domain-containing protein [Cystobacter fuscus]|uniref:RHS repeat-associated core domain-containing protein n=1 Tax=Cystobacter fuscus TaxID=43 RepID=UPI0037BFB6CD
MRLAWPGGPANTISQGVVLEGYEYQRHQTGTQPFWTPMRFPGQYHDAETDLFENWNRYYDPSIGRYLQPEPMLRNPQMVLTTARQSHWLPTYAYALSNPVNITDSTGNAPSLDSINAHMLSLLMRGEIAGAIAYYQLHRGTEKIPRALSVMQNAFNVVNQRVGPCRDVARDIAEGFKFVGQKAEFLKFTATDSY